MKHRIAALTLHHPHTNSAAQEFRSAHIALNHSWLYHGGGPVWLILAAVIFAAFALSRGNRKRSRA